MHARRGGNCGNPITRPRRTTWLGDARAGGKEGTMEFPIESQEQLDEAIKDRLARERRKVREQYAGQLAAG